MHLKHTLLHLLVNIWKFRKVNHLVLNSNASLYDYGKRFLSFISIPHIGPLNVNPLGYHLEEVGTDFPRRETDGDDCSAGANVLEDISASFQGIIETFKSPV